MIKVVMSCRGGRYVYSATPPALYSLGLRMGRVRMWTVIFIAQSAKHAKHIIERLSQEGFLAKLRQTNVTKQQYEILVPEAELDEVQEVLKDILHSSYE
jgi:acetylornithine/succinyldiaminopimelate/putrescine aminotransferase